MRLMELLKITVLHFPFSYSSFPLSLMPATGISIYIVQIYIHLFPRELKTKKKNNNNIL